MIAFADNFLAGSLLTLLMPTLLLVAIAIWFVVAVRHVPEDTPEASAKLPHPDGGASAGSDVHEIAPSDPPAGQA